MGSLSGGDVSQDTGIEVCRAILTMRQIMERAVPLMKKQGETRSGGFFCLSGENMAPLVLIEPYGEMSEEKRGKYAELAREKLVRLSSFPSHSTSYQSRNPDAVIVDSQKNERSWGKWGGAVRAGDYIASFSGLPELWDEAIMFVLAVRMGWISEADTLRRISRKRNPHLRLLLEATQSIE